MCECVRVCVRCCETEERNGGGQGGGCIFVRVRMCEGDRDSCICEHVCEKRGDVPVCLRE